jgi:hypothetical protein
MRCETAAAMDFYRAKISMRMKGKRMILGASAGSTKEQSTASRARSNSIPLSAPRYSSCEIGLFNFKSNPVTI